MIHDSLQFDEQTNVWGQMKLNDLLKSANIDPEQVIIFRHRPTEPEFKKVLPWLAAEKLDLYNAYQQTQGEKVENAMQGAKYVASFIGHEPAKALFVGLYEIGASISLTHAQYQNHPAKVEIKALGNSSFAKEERSSILWFDLVLTDFYASWKGKLIVGWPPPERSWWRRAHRNEMPILAVLEDSALDAVMPEWEQISLTWEQLSVLPIRWKGVLSQWRGIYYIFDTSDAKGYVGSACGHDNLLGRWLNYATTGHGGNRLLLRRNPRNFRFTILQRVSPDMQAEDIVRIEGTWKERLHTGFPYGLNDN